MKTERKLQFSVADKADGHEVTPETVPLGLLKEFVKDVATFIRGGDKEIDAAELLVSVVEGSLALHSYDPLPTDIAIWQDIEQLSRGSLDGVDTRRASIAEKWRLEAIKHPTRVFRIADGKNEVAINANTYFHQERTSNWVLVERYLSGTVEDWGGLTAPNIHLRLDDGSTLKVDATRDQIREQERNPVYHQVVIRVELEEDLATGERRSARFIDFASYQPRVDEGEYQTATAIGLTAWDGIDDAAEWVREIRGGKE